MIRKATTGDRDMMQQILVDTGTFDSQEIDTALELVDEYLKNGSGEYHVYVETNKKRIRGFMCYGKAALSENAHDLYWLAVHPDSHGQNIGTQLLNFAEDDVIKNGGRMILIETSSSSEYKKARTFYRRCGYLQTARIPDFYSGGDDKLILMKKLKHVRACHSEKRSDEESPQILHSVQNDTVFTEHSRLKEE